LPAAPFTLKSTEQETPPVLHAGGVKVAVRPRGEDTAEKEMESVLTPGQLFLAVAVKLAWVPAALTEKKVRLVLLDERATHGGGV
jgi:hypothetical protein